MKLIKNHKWWWFLLIVATLIVSIITSQQINLMDLLITVVAHLVFSIIVATLPWLVYWLTGKPLNTEQMMTTITIGWLILTVANLSVMS